MAFAVAATRGALFQDGLSSKDTPIAANDRWNELTVAYVWMTEPEVQFEDARLVDDPLTLASGRRVWLTARPEVMEGIEDEPEPADPPVVSAVIEPKDPRTSDVTAPGLFVRGVRITDSRAA